jgi:NAD(P)-dependent dehydrogenase (short-subunit alcohol dehydrogenase family)
VPSGDSPDGTEATLQINQDGLSTKSLFALPVGKLPTGAGESPAPPIFRTHSKGSAPASGAEAALPAGSSRGLVARDKMCEESGIMAQKTIVLTGATRGLGRAMTDEFIRPGHTVVGCGRSAGEIAQLRKLHGPPHDFTAVDVTSDEQVEAWAARVLASHGAPDFLLNNAGVINKNAPLWKISAREFSTVIDVNLKGAANVIRHFVPAMIKAKRGVIVNFSSGWGRSTDRDVAPYCASKWGIEGLTQAFAQELPPGLAAVALNPGIVNTEMLQSCFGGSASGYPAPDAWAKTAVPFLLGLGPEQNGRQLNAP